MVLLQKRFPPFGFPPNQHFSTISVISVRRKGRRISLLLATLLASSALFEAEAQPWVNEPSLPIDLYGHVAAVSSASGQERLYVFGGGGDSILFSRNDVFTPGSGWTTAAPLPTPRRFATETVDHLGRIWVIGGTMGPNSALNTVEVYDPTSHPGTWTTMPPLQVGRTKAAAATDRRGRIFVFGGGVGTGPIPVDSVEMFDPVHPEDGWVPRDTMPAPHVGLGAELGCDGMIYVMGRVDRVQTSLAVNFAYDPEDDEWLAANAKATPPLVPGDFALGGRGMTVGPDERIYLINDGDEVAPNDARVFSYDPQNDQWRIEPSTNSGLTDLAAATLDGKVFAIAGRDRHPPINGRRVEALGPIHPNSPCAPQCVAPPPGMVSWLPFDERAGSVAADLIAGRDGSHVGQPSPEPGKVAGALDLAGPGFLVIGHDGALNFGSGDLSIDAWLRDPTVGALVGKYDSQAGRGYELYLEQVTSPFALDVGVGLNGASHLFSSCLVPDDGEWHHLGIVVDRSAVEVQCYLDGFLRETLPILDMTSINNTAPVLVSQGQFSAFDYGGLVDELELFDRALGPGEMQAIFGAGAEGKCKDSIHLPWDQRFCLGVSHVQVYVDVCNYSTTPRTYELSFQYLPSLSPVTGGKCTIDGPDGFESLMPIMPIPPALSVTVMPGCLPVPIRIERPMGMTMAKQVGCYQVTRVDTATGGTAIATGSVQDRRDLCRVRGPNGGGTGILSVGDVQLENWEFRNTTGAVANFDFRIEAMADSLEAGREVVSLNQQEPGLAVEGSLTIPADGSATIPFSVEYTQPDPFRFQELIVSSREAGEEEFIPLDSMAMRNPLPWDDGFGGLVGDRVWEDLNGNGFQDGGESGLPGVLVRLHDAAGNGLANAMTNALGNFYFPSVPVGLHEVRIDTGTLPVGAQATFDLDGGLDHRAEIVVQGGGTHAGVDFGYQVVEEPTVQVFTDATAWQQAAGRMDCETFEEEDLPPFGTAPTPFTSTRGVLFTTLTPPPEVLIQYLNPGNIFANGEFHFRDSGQGVRVTPPAPSLALGFHYATGPETWVAAANGQQTTLPSSASGFLGYVFTTPSSFFDLTGGPGEQGGISIDELCIGVGSGEIFSDGFESGDTSEWTSTQP
ncbi:MAG: hypothetical protein K0U98_01130 [Deltaproteobacteria bacterium]|nr:hypothetical protein [Deltaproteobacteria bacterium]